MSITKFVKYTTIVDESKDAFVFYMAHAEEFDKPNLEMRAIWVLDTEDESQEYLEKFEVSIYGDIELPSPE